MCSSTTLKDGNSVLFRLFVSVQSLQTLNSSFAMHFWFFLLLLLATVYCSVLGAVSRFQ